MSIKLKDIQSAIDKSLTEYDLAITNDDKDYWQRQIKLYEEMYRVQQSIIKTKLLKQMEGLS